MNDDLYENTEKGPITNVVVIDKNVKDKLLSYFARGY